MPATRSPTKQLWSWAEASAPRRRTRLGRTWPGSGQRTKTATAPSLPDMVGIALYRGRRSLQGESAADRVHGAQRLHEARVVDAVPRLLLRDRGAEELGE